MGALWVLWLLLSKNMHIRFIVESKLTVKVTVHGCLPHLSQCGPAIDWCVVQGPALSLNGSWDRLQSLHDPELD